MLNQSIKIRLFFMLLLSGIKLEAANLSVDTNRIIRADFNAVKEARSKVYQKCIAAGRASEGLRADWQHQLKIVKNDIGFEYIRFHGLLSDDMHVYTEDANGKPVYNWQYVDKVYDFLLSIKVRPFVELGFMPPALASADKTVFWWKGNITPPKSYERWSELITALTKHFEERYGKAEVEKWYFEVWNEPNLKEFYSGDREEYFKMYAVTAKAVKAVSKTYRVGGPATSSSTWMKESLEYFATIPQLVDFISTHAYGTKTVLDQYGKGQTKMREPDGIPNAIRKLRVAVDQSAMKNREVHITEWNSSSSPRDPIHDTYQNATFMLNTLKKTEHLVNSMVCWTFTDIFEEAGPPVTPFHGGFGLMNLQEIKKPSYFAYQFLNGLGDQELVNRDSSSWVCKSKNSLQILFWDYKLLAPDTLSNQQFFSKDIPAKSKGSVKLVVNHIPNGSYTMKVYRTGYHKNDAYSEYIKMGAPYNINKQQEERLKLIASGKAESEKVVIIKNGVLTADFPLRENDVFFVTLNK